MGKIIQLDEAIANKIAAGEVVERPASVVKELVENSIDAASTVIEVDVEEAGLKKIRVIDNGEGMDKEDVKTAFERHATSKIRDENDLFRIATLGFRGEALPSIASVSRVELTTSTGEGPGTRIKLEGGKPVLIEPASSRKGTDITVTDLFYNTPARLKYMKSIHTELGKITDTMNRIAMGHPDIAFKLRHNGRVLLQTNGNGDIRQVLANIYGLQTIRQMIPIAGESLDFKVSGYISLPELTRASRNYISIVINGRFIKNYALTNAIINGYHTLLMTGRYPICYISVEMDPVLVDVNVHPAKLEVRLSKERELGELITDSIRSAFEKQSLIRRGQAPKRQSARTEQIQFELDHLSRKKEGKFERTTLTKPERTVVKRFLQQLEKDLQEPATAPKSNGKTMDRQPEQIREQSLQETNNVKSTEATFDLQNDIYETIAEKSAGSRIPPLYPIGQFHGTYILAENEHGLYIIDQHAAQERIKYEYYRKKIGEVPEQLQELLIPMTLEFPADDFIQLQELVPELEKVGVFLEPFGTNTFIVRNHPDWFPPGEEEETIREIIDQVLQMKKVDIGKLREEAAIMMSCKGSIKANHRLRTDEIQQLLDTLRNTENPFSCPHGRPVIIHFSTQDLEKMFKRIQ